MRKFVKILLIIIVVLLFLAVSYASYVFLSYYRVEDNLALEVENQTDSTVPVGEEIECVSFNIGFGAYEPDFDFFMDGGTKSRAISEDRLKANIAKIGDLLYKQDADIYLMQEVDEKGTRTYHFNERSYFTNALSDRNAVWAQNWDCPFLLYPINEPHGKNLSGIMTFSKFGITSAKRRSLPIEDSLMKLVDLDRCYSVARSETENGRELIIYNVHLSAYTRDGKIVTDQVEMLISDMKCEYEKGNYVICGGDFNKDILGNSGEVFGVSGEEYTWAQPFPTEFLKDTMLSIQVPFNKDNPVPSCRNADSAYHEKQFVLTVDGFIVSDNVEVSSSEVIDTGFEYSDHNPVLLRFILK